MLTKGDIDRCYEHAKKIGLTVDVPKTSYGVYTTIAFLMRDATKFIYCFSIATDEQSINVSYFVGNKQYHSKLLPEEFQKLTKQDLIELKVLAHDANAKHEILEANIKALPKTHKMAVTSLFYRAYKR